jgi:transcriptional regulator with XRE-family HTH domain
MQAGLKALLDKHRISQRELAHGIGKSDAAISRLVSGATGASQETINDVLVFLSKRLHRRVTYEQVFGRVEVSA